MGQSRERFSVPHSFVYLKLRLEIAVQNVKVAAAVLNQTPLDWQTNVKNIRAAMQLARNEEVAVLCLPELCITGYGCEDAFLSAEVRRRAWQTLEELAAETSGMVVLFGLPISYRGLVFNAAALAVNGELVGLVPKQHLAGDGIHYEPRWFKAWPEGETAMYEAGDYYVELGDLMFNVGGIMIGVEICEDAWVAPRPGARLAERGADIILNPSASHFAFGKQEIRRRFVLEGSRTFHAAYVYSNLVGNEAGRAIYDGGAMIAENGKMVVEGPRFSYHDCVVTSAVVDIDVNRMNRAKSDSFELDFEAAELLTSDVPFDMPLARSQYQSVDLPSWEKSEHLKEEEFTRAVSLGLFDYMRKSRSRGFVVSLSGGADSAAVTVLCGYMVQFALRDIGTQGFFQKVPYVKEIEGLTIPGDFLEHLLTCVYQATENSGETTKNASRTLAEKLGAKFHELNVDAICKQYIQLGEQVVGRTLSWEEDDIALQNIQARTRSPGVWLLANLTGALLLSTSNRSEAAVGYATMDGDTSGGLCPISGIDKNFIRHWLKWLEEEGPVEVGCLPVLKVITDQEPTAELRPAEQTQTDEDDLMPYSMLDLIERQAIRDKQMPMEIFEHLQDIYINEDPQRIATWIDKFFRLWSRNQWKRERYAPGFHLDDENLDPKTWCRFPILSGGFDAELKAMWDRATPPISEDDETED